MRIVNTAKNRDRDQFSFANINLLDKCNAQCFFCLGKDIPEYIDKFRSNHTPYWEWPRFFKFLDHCKEEGIDKLYITGQNTDSLLYLHLYNLIKELQRMQFLVGLRTNGFKALQMIKTINICDLSVGYSIHTINSMTQKMIMGRSDLPDWKSIISATKHPRISIVLNRCNKSEFFELLRFLSAFENVRYIQVRRVSTDTRANLLMADMIAYEEVYTQVRDIFPVIETLWGDADVFKIYGKDVVFWRTIKTKVNSLNYFTDGTISDSYFIVEGYLANRFEGESK
jgi:molybdenum cofactor biosynthesis enzyme MoaA